LGESPGYWALRATFLRMAGNLPAAIEALARAVAESTDEAARSTFQGRLEHYRKETAAIDPAS
jgi:predicted RNA polymerase sigma factor